MQPVRLLGDEALNVIEKIVHEFHALDPPSFSFRYSMKKNGKFVQLPDFAIDLEHLRDVMEGVNNFFTGVDGQLDYNSSAADYY